MTDHPTDYVNLDARLDAATLELRALTEKVARIADSLDAMAELRALTEKVTRIADSLDATADPLNAEGD